jgi:hypothetical protein
MSAWHEDKLRFPGDRQSQATWNLLPHNPYLTINVFQEIFKLPTRQAT